MKVIQCEKGHFYDSEKYEECPVCIKMASKMKEATNKTEKIKSINDIDLSTLKECEEATEIITHDSSLNEPHTTKPADPIKVEQIVSNNSIVERPDDDGETQVSFWGTKTVESVASNETISVPDDALTQVLGGFTEHEERNFKPMKKRHNGPVVGWLVAIDGPHQGQSFELYAKKNFIGRSDDNIVCLAMDKTVSRTSPLCVIFDNKKCEFIAMAGNSDQTAYINDQLVLQPIILKARDCVVLGNSSLLFIPFITSENDFESTYLAGK